MRTKSANDINRQYDRIRLAVYKTPYTTQENENKIFSRLEKADKIVKRYISNLQGHLAPAGREGWYKPAAWWRNMDTQVSTHIYAAN